MRLTSKSSSQGTSLTWYQVEKKLGISTSMPTIHKECVTKLQHKSRKYAYSQAPGLFQRCKKGKLKEGCNNVHITRSSASQKMMVELIGAANDMCTLHGISVYLEHQEDLQVVPRSLLL